MTFELAKELANDASAVTYPNPDADGSEAIGAEDLIELFIYFDNRLASRYPRGLCLPAYSNSWQACSWRSRNTLPCSKTSCKPNLRRSKALRRC